MSWTGVVGLAVIALYFLGINELVLLAASGLLVMLGKNLRRWRDGGGVPAALGPATLLPGLGRMALAAVPFSLPLLFLSFLKIGAVLYGGGYVLIAFLQAEFVGAAGLADAAQLLDAVAIGQVTPGPLFTTATFIGYVLGGVPGGVIATVGIFLPAFVFVALEQPAHPTAARRSRWAGAFLDGINAAVARPDGRRDLATGPARPCLTRIERRTGGLAGSLLFLFRVSSLWLVLGGAVIGLMAGRSCNWWQNQRSLCRRHKRAWPGHQVKEPDDATP